MWKATLLLQWLHDEDAIAGYNTLRIIPLLEAFKGAKWKDFFWRLIGDGLLSTDRIVIVWH